MYAERAGEGRLAEILGPEAGERDRFARLLRYRGDMEAEWTRHAPDAKPIIAPVIRGVNAFPGRGRAPLPAEIQLAGLAP